jgi:hypothetical protein
VRQSQVTGHDRPAYARCQACRRLMTSNYHACPDCGSFELRNVDRFHVVRGPWASGRDSWWIADALVPGASDRLPFRSKADAEAYCDVLNRGERSR